MTEQNYFTLILTIAVVIGVLGTIWILRKRIASFFVKVGPVQAGGSTLDQPKHKLKNVEQVATSGDNQAHIDGPSVEIDGLSQKSNQGNVLRVGKPPSDE